MPDTLEIIGLSGNAGTGKDYIYQHFFRPQGYLRWSFADHFKIWIIGKGEANYDDVFNVKPEAIRKLLQEEGTERGRNVYGEDIWVNVALEWMQHLSKTCGLNKWVVPDVRFPNEVTGLQKMNGRVFRLHAPLRAKNNNLTPALRLHISETALIGYDGFDGFIYNDPKNSETVGLQVAQLLGLGYDAADDPESIFDRIFNTISEKFGF